MSNKYSGLDTCNISPVRSKMKHSTTPMRTRRKTSRRDQGIDVHTTCSTPTAHRSPRLQRPNRNSPVQHVTDFESPSSSFPYSQDTQPDVIWDFTSPKLPNGARRKEMKITVEELLENLNQCQSPDCNTKSAPYVKLLEKWMLKKPSEVTVKKIETNKKELRKRSRRRIEELTKFIDSIQRSKEAGTGSNLRLKENCVQAKSDATDPKANFKNSFLEGGSTDDSSEELWGDTDSSFIIKATQELDKITVFPAQTNPEIISTIPATLTNGPAKPKSPVITRDEITCTEHSEILSQLTDINWDDCDDEWDNGFIVEDDDLSLVPDEVLSGQSATISNGTVREPKVDQSGAKFPGTVREQKADQSAARSNTTVQKSKVDQSDAMSHGIVQQSKVDQSVAISGLIQKHKLAVGSKAAQSMVLKTEEATFSLSEVGLSVAAQSNAPSAELFNSFEDDSFEDEDLLCQPEILSRIDEVESMLSQPKCTPEEIRKKKDEAIKRRKSQQSKKKT